MFDGYPQPPLTCCWDWDCRYCTASTPNVLLVVLAHIQPSFFTLLYPPLYASHWNHILPNLGTVGTLADPLFRSHYWAYFFISCLVIVLAFLSSLWEPPFVATWHYLITLLEDLMLSWRDHLTIKQGPWLSRHIFMDDICGGTLMVRIPKPPADGDLKC